MLKKKLDTCLNCGREVEGNFCPNCGQPAVDYNNSVWTFLSDFLDDYFTFDSKFFRSFIPLIVKPGFLTNEYIAGKRVRYILPLRMYLFISVIFFLVFSTSKYKSTIYKSSPSKPKVATADLSQVKPDPIVSNEGEIDTSLVSTDTLHDTTTQASSNQNKPMSSYREFKQHFFQKMRIASKNPEIVSNTAVTHFPKMMFFLLPVFALMLKVLYRRSSKFLIEHLIFSLHLHSFVFVFLSVLVFIVEFIDSTSFGKTILRTSLFIIATYTYVAMRAVYKQSYLKTFIKLGMLGLSYIFVMSFSILAVFIVTILLF